MGETLEQRAEFAAELAELDPDEVPLNFLNPRPGTPFGDLEVMPASEALKSVAAFRLALPRTMLRFAGGREITLGDLGAKQGILGGINAVIVGNYLTTLGPARRGRPASCSTTCRCRSRRSTPACRDAGLMVQDLGAPVGAGVYNVYTGEFGWHGARRRPPS